MLNLFLVLALIPGSALHGTLHPLWAIVSLLVQGRKESTISILG